MRKIRLYDLLHFNCTQYLTHNLCSSQRLWYSLLRRLRICRCAFFATIWNECIYNCLELKRNLLTAHLLQIRFCEATTECLYVSRQMTLFIHNNNKHNVEGDFVSQGKQHLNMKTYRDWLEPVSGNTNFSLLDENIAFREGKI